MSNAATKPRPETKAKPIAWAPWLVVATAAVLITIAWFAPRSHAPDFRAHTEVTERKRAFVAYVCPMIRRHNETIEQERALVTRARARRQQGSAADNDIIALGEKYGLTTSVDADLLIERLLRRVDRIPESLVLAQAAVESGWGTSRLYRDTGNLFGRRCFYVDRCYEHPDTGTRYRVFDHPGESVSLYFRDLNSLLPYKPLRDLRAANASNGLRLAEGLRAYSSRGGDYVRQVQRVIEENQLHDACSAV